jgi:glutamine amidotransferase
MTIAVPGIRCGNFASVIRMIQKCGGSATIIDNPGELAGFDKIILAGVGSFDTGMRSLHDGGWIEPLTDVVLGENKPILGICLGMQLMCASSDEGKLPGLGWFDATVRRFAVGNDVGLKVPHMGWNTVDLIRSTPLLPVNEAEQRFYFVHSYHAVSQRPEDVAATTRYGHDLVAALYRRNLFGVQFHPEKSHRFGKALLTRFIEL